MEECGDCWGKMREGRRGARAPGLINQGGRVPWWTWPREDKGGMLLVHWLVGVVLGGGGTSSSTKEWREGWCVCCPFYYKINKTCSSLKHKRQREEGRYSS